MKTELRVSYMWISLVFLGHHSALRVAGSGAVLNHIEYLLQKDTVWRVLFPNEKTEIMALNINQF